IAGTNTVQITATDTAGRQSIHNVTLTYVSGQTWPNNYSINWSTAGSIQNVAQIVDGQWQIQPDGTVRTMQTGYDRLLNIGGRTNWQNYLVTAEVTVNWLDPFGFGFGLVAGWQGHSSVQYGQTLTIQPRIGHPFYGTGTYDSGSAPASLSIQENTLDVVEGVLARDTSGFTLQIGVEYIFKFQVQQNSMGGSHFSFKVWPASAAEP